MARSPTFPSLKINKLIFILRKGPAFLFFQSTPIPFLILKEKMEKS
eukprot:UN00959